MNDLEREALVKAYFAAIKSFSGSIGILRYIDFITRDTDFQGSEEWLQASDQWKAMDCELNEFLDLLVSHVERLRQ